MDHKLLQMKVSEIEIAALMNDENMLPAGKNIIRRMAFEIDLLKSKLKELENDESLSNKQ